MQIPLRASGSSEIFPGTSRRPDQTQSHYWPYGQQGTTDRGEKGCSRGRKGKKRGGGIFTTWTHTPHPQGESKLQSALQDRGRSQTGVHLKDEWERKRGAGRNRWREKCEYMLVDNCGQLWTSLRCVRPCLPSSCLMLQPQMSTDRRRVLYLSQSVRILKIYICKCTSVGSPGWRRRLVWLDNHAPAWDKEKVFCEKKTWAAVLHPGWPRRCSPCDWGQPGDSSLAS